MREPRWGEHVRAQPHRTQKTSDLHRRFLLSPEGQIEKMVMQSIAIWLELTCKSSDMCGGFAEPAEQLARAGRASAKKP